jgi:hypothetical protein
MREFNETEIDAYNTVRNRQLAEVEKLTKKLTRDKLSDAEAVSVRTKLDSIEVLPEFTAGHMHVAYAENGITTHANILLPDAESEIPDRRGWAVISREDLRKHKQVPEVGRAIAFNRALHDPLIWQD